MRFDNSCVWQASTKQQLHKQESGVKQLHQRSKACFHQLRLAQKGPPAESSQLPSSDAVQHAESKAGIQPECAALPMPSAIDQPIQELAAPAGFAAAVPQQPRSVSPVKGDCPEIAHHTPLVFCTVNKHHLLLIAAYCKLDLAAECSFVVSAKGHQFALSVECRAFVDSCLTSSQ